MNFAKIISFASFLIAVGCGTTANHDEGNSESASTSQALVTHRNWNGSGASAGFGDRTSWSWIDVNENGDYAWLSFSRSAADPTSWKCESVTFPPKGTFPAPPPGEWCRYTRFTYEYATGQISGADFRATAGAAHLNTTIDTSKGFWGEKCTYNEETFDSTCAPLALIGSIAIDWKKNNQFSQISNGTNESRYGKYMFRSTGTFRNSSADATGSFLGAAFSGQGGIASTNGVTVSKDYFVTR